VIGRTVSHYQIVGQLGAGGMGVVYAAEDSRLGRQVALKFVPEELAKDRQAVERLRSEARTASSLNHPNICTIYDIGEHEGRPYIVMELLRGQTLRERLAGGPLKIHDAVELGIQVADALDAAHHRGIMHRDIKPANLFLVERGQVKILDFGLAKIVRQAASSTTTQSTHDHTAEGITLGTVSYMSPEQVTGELLDGRTDLFSLGVVLYECVTGHQPFTGKTSAVIFSQILTRAPVAPVVFNPELPLRLQEVINNCLEKDRELRYQDAAGLRADLRRVKRDLESGHSGVFRIGTTSNTTTGFGSGQQAVHTDSGTKPTAEQSGANRQPSVTAIAAAVFLGVALAIGLSVIVWQRTRPAPPAPAPGVSQDYVRTRRGLATTSLEAKNYREAVSYADDVLRVAPDDPEATRIRDAARAILARFDHAATRTRERLAAGDLDGATSALNEARSIEPGSPVVSELSAALVAQLRTQAESARRDTTHSRPAPPPPPSRQAANEPAREGPRRDSGARAPVPPPAATETPAPQPTPAVQPPASTPAPQPPAPEPRPAQPQQPSAPSPPAPARPEPQTPAAPAPANPAAAGATEPSPERRETGGAGRAGAVSPVETDDAAIRRTVQSYARAIETKDIALFRRLKPNMTGDEQRRIEDGFRAVASQQVNINILSVEVHGQDASVRLRRRDTIHAGGREQTTESVQTMTLVRSGSGWVIREIGR
jgi:serine/threonine protein kinase